MNLEDKVVLVTGSSGGLGAKICYEAAKQGAIVISCARRMAFVEGVRDECRRLSGKEAYAFKVDVSNPESVDELYEKVMEEVGRMEYSGKQCGFWDFRRLPYIRPWKSIRYV